ncbi:amino acid ABC transporter permease [Streptomyces antimycoticus]|uniref:amino acid ABC transporter permease n=1 Tax=Streptomyces antimycoticus TaxID=68175 RepID=UPI003687B453
MDWPYWGQFVSGLVLTLEVTVLAFAGAVILGLLAVAMRISRASPLRAAAAVYVEGVRNVPALALVFLVVYGLPEIGPSMSLFWSVVIVLAFYEGAFACEALRQGVNGVDVKTAEAARALGFTNRQTLRLVVLPQALCNVVQPLTNVFIKTTLNSSLVAIVGLADLTGVAQRVNLREAQPLLFVAAGLVYVVIALVGGQIGGLIERKARIQR